MTGLTLSEWNWLLNPTPEKPKKKRIYNKGNGINGISYSPRKGLFKAAVYQDREPLQLYIGKDFFEACCARKSWETTRTAKQMNSISTEQKKAIKALKGEVFQKVLAAEYGVSIATISLIQKEKR